jgi:hypothetical protein
MTDFIFLSVAFGEQYIEQQYRLTGSIMQIYPNASLTFWYDGYPYGSKTHHESLYGFKAHAVKSALSEGYKKIIWLDTACILQKPVDYWFTLNQPVLAARDDNKLKGLVSDKALKHFGHEQCPEHLHLVGGSLYVFDFNHPDCENIFNTWAEAEQAGMFGPAGEKLGGHRHDESCMALALDAHGYGPVSCEELKYNSGSGSIILKQHFK